MQGRRILGMLTPSSNTVLEPVTTEMLRPLANVSAHFSRFRVTEISLSQYGLSQFDRANFLSAAGLLADAKCQVIAWNGTSAGWLGFEYDEALCAGILETTGTAATTSVLATRDLFRRHGVKRFGLVTPYTDDVQARVVENFRTAGFDCVAEEHLGIRDNFSFAEVGRDELLRMCRSVAQSSPDGISILCTNLAGAPLASQIEAETGIPVYDSISVVVLRALELAGEDPTRIEGWGRIFSMKH